MRVESGLYTFSHRQRRIMNYKNISRVYIDSIYINCLSESCCFNVRILSFKQVFLILVSIVALPKQVQFS